jgi:hypothetical protein
MSEKGFCFCLFFISFIIMSAFPEKSIIGIGNYIQFEERRTIQNRLDGR